MVKSELCHGTGFMQPQARAKCLSRSWDETKASSQVTLPLTFSFQETHQWLLGEHVIAQSGDRCIPGSWVFVRQSEVCSHCNLTMTTSLTVSSVGYNLYWAHFWDLVPESLSSNCGVVTMEIFELRNTLHPEFDMPILQRTTSHHRYATISSEVQIYIDFFNKLLKSLQNVQFKFSAQHDCRMVHCQPSALWPQMQEQQETCWTISLIAHEDDGHFILNLHALHNVTIIWKFLPCHLTTPRPLYTNRTT